MDTYTGRRNFRSGAQGVIVWHRTLAGRPFRFTLVVNGWWGVGETGTLRVSAEPKAIECSPGDWYPVRQARVGEDVISGCVREFAADMDRVQALVREMDARRAADEYDRRASFGHPAR